jgi:AAA domain-containing protein
MAETIDAEAANNQLDGRPAEQTTTPHAMLVNEQLVYMKARREAEERLAVEDHKSAMSAGTSGVDDWANFDQPEPPPDWVVPDMIERGQAISIVAPGGAGKSIWTLWQTLQLARAGERVGYLDYENTRGTYRGRYKRMGATVDDLAGQVCHWSYPDLPPLDTRLGGRELTNWVDENKITVLVIDTISSVVAGDEDKSSTWLAFYRLSVVPLKARGVTMVLLDHTGKDIARGDRGSSAKRQKWDGQYVVTAGSMDEGFLTFDSRPGSGGKNRSDSMAKLIKFDVVTSPLGFEGEPMNAAQFLVESGQAREERDAAILETWREEGIEPRLWGRDRARDWCKAHGRTIATADLADLVRQYKAGARN